MYSLGLVILSVRLHYWGLVFLEFVILVLAVRFALRHNYKTGRLEGGRFWIMFGLGVIPAVLLVLTLFKEMPLVLAIFWFFVQLVMLFVLVLMADSLGDPRPEHKIRWGNRKVH